MPFVFDDKTVGVWFVPTTPIQDWMASVREITPGQEYEIKYRFRNHKDSKVFETQDVRHWETRMFKGTRQGAIEVARKLANGLAVVAGQQHNLYELLNNTGIRDFFKKFADAPFTYMRSMSVKEAEEKYPDLVRKAREGK